MTRHTKTMTAMTGALLLAGAAMAQGQPSGTSTSGTTTTTTIKSGVVVYAGGNTLVVKESDGVTREHFVPDGFTFQMGGKNVTLADLKAGDHITAVITDVKQVTPVTVTKELKGKVLESSMGSILCNIPMATWSSTPAKTRMVETSSSSSMGRQLLSATSTRARPNDRDHQIPTEVSRSGRLTHT